ncbi:MAG: carboxy terminal-processing peptidase [Bacteroidetes bacterium]|nr:carboxy terminal-processing peptidase [Bacteroidota bacterium]MBL6963607.1 carboxy terminal-processing peptidase [Bacteroidota bacterium]
MLRFRRLVIFTVFIPFFLHTSFTPPSLTEQRTRLVQVLFDLVRSAHFTFPEINDEYSERVFNLFIERIDIGKRFLTQDDVDQLSMYKSEIDDQVRNSTFEFYDLAVRLQSDQILRVKKYYHEYLNNPFDFTKEEFIQTDSEKLPFAKNQSELKEYWRLFTKYQTIIRLDEMVKTQDVKKQDNDSGFVEKSFSELEKKAREKVMKNLDDYFKRLEKLNEDDKLGLYINTLATAIDPHTEYYAPKQKEDFDIRMSGRLEGIGASLQQSDDYIKVSRIVPGSASWKQGDLKAGDIILMVAQGDKEAVDIVGMRLDEAVLLIRGKKGTEVRLTVKKRDGSIKVISIIRDIVILEETFAKSVTITNNESKSKIGYIKLPQFYTDFTKTGGPGCAEDIRHEIAKLKNEKIEGIVFDLRDNGGGSLNDVVKIAGYFIPRGPIVQVKSRYGKPTILEDFNSEVLYGGPLVFLVNSFSASASEILVAAMQDYKRAIIIGSKSTFGKGTVQRFIELDPWAYQSGKNYSGLGSVKVTIQKFYRINGETTQLKGVVPDIILPDVYNYVDVGEKELIHPLPWNEIKAVDYSIWSSPNNLDFIEKHSEKRISSNEAFNLIDENAKWLKLQGEKTMYSLNYEDYHNMMLEFEKESKKFEGNENLIEGISVSTLPDDQDKIEGDEGAKARSEAWHNEIKKDAYIHEAISVIGDI